MLSREFVWKVLNDPGQSQGLCVNEFRVVSGDEAERWVTADAQFHYAATADACRTLGMAVEINDRKRSEEKLRESEERLAGIISSSMDAIVGVDEEQRIVLFNSAAERVFGCARGEAIGSFINRFIPERFRDVHDGYIRPSSQTGVNNRKTGTINSMWATRATGERFPVEVSVSQVETAGKKLFTAIIRDVTERHREQDARRQSEERFRLVVDSAPVLIWMSGPDKLRSYFNQAWLDFTGRPIEAELGNGWACGVHPEDLSLCLDIYDCAYDRSESFKMQYRLRRNDGEYRWVMDIGVQRLNPDGLFAGYTGSCIDVTERKTAEDALNGVIGRLIAVHEEERKKIAREIHDDYNQRLAMLAIDLEEFAEKIENCPADAGERLLQIWNGISELGADLHSLSHNLHSSTLESLGLIEGARAFCEEFAGQQKIQVDFAHENVPRDVPEDAALCLFRIVQESLRNVKRHSGADTAEVRLEALGQKLHLSVADRGMGFHVNMRSARDGIGIKSMEERLRSLGGHLEIYSRPMEGTRIDAWLPLNGARPHATSERSPQAVTRSENVESRR